MDDNGRKTKPIDPSPLSQPALGLVGAWSGRLQRRPTSQAIEVVNELEELGYHALWIPESPFGKDDLTFSAV